MLSRSSRTGTSGGQPKPKRRVFTNKYKLEVLERADRCGSQGEVGALLREEGLYSSHLSNWRRLRREGNLGTLTKRRRGPKPRKSAQDCELEKLRRENARLERKLEEAEFIIDAQKKLARLLKEQFEIDVDGERS